MKTIADIIHHKVYPLEILENKGKHLYYEDSYGCWAKSQYDSNGFRIYFENSKGWIMDDNRP